ncbi:MAG: ATP-binding protein [Bacteroidales bacterium]|nr:ATP-binding protein [Bacteroidales bacterium]
MNAIHIEDTIVIPSDLSNINQIEKLIDNQSSILKFDDEVYGKLLLSVVEAVNNCIVHGNKSDVKKNVTIDYVIDNNYIEYKISDEGKGFDYNSVPDPTLAENLEKDCGRGIYLMRHLSDNVEFSNNGSTVTLKFCL